MLCTGPADLLAETFKLKDEHSKLAYKKYKDQFNEEFGQTKPWTCSWYEKKTKNLFPTPLTPEDPTNIATS